MKEKLTKGMSGFLALLILAAIIITAITMISSSTDIADAVLVFGGLGFILSILILKGFLIIYPNNSAVLTFFGKYVGTAKDNGFFWVNPFYRKKKISLRASNFDSERVKVNDKRGNPILISVIAVWKVSETYKAAFEVDNYDEFVHVQTDAAVRKLAGMYSYDTFDDDAHDEITLRSDVGEVNVALETELTERLGMAGIEVIEARIGYLAYAPEIASAMLKRQQAEAVVSARYKIVEGAVGMVELALEQLNEKGVVDLDEERKAAMVSNLMVILCSDKEATPVVNAGTLHT